MGNNPYLIHGILACAAVVYFLCVSVAGKNWVASLSPNMRKGMDNPILVGASVGTFIQFAMNAYFGAMPAMAGFIGSSIIGGIIGLAAKIYNDGQKKPIVRDVSDMPYVPATPDVPKKMDTQKIAIIGVVLVAIAMFLNSPSFGPMVSPSGGGPSVGGSDPIMDSYNNKLESERHNRDYEENWYRNHPYGV